MVIALVNVNKRDVPKGISRQFIYFLTQLYMMILMQKERQPYLPVKVLQQSDLCRDLKDMYITFADSVLVSTDVKRYQIWKSEILYHHVGAPNITYYNSISNSKVCCSNNGRDCLFDYNKIVTLQVGKHEVEEFSYKSSIEYPSCLQAVKVLVLVPGLQFDLSDNSGIPVLAYHVVYTFYCKERIQLGKFFCPWDVKGK